MIPLRTGHYEEYYTAMAMVQVCALLLTVGHSKVVEEEPPPLLEHTAINNRIGMLLGSHPHVNIEHCQRKLGMGSGEIASDSITVSESLAPESQWGKNNARLIPYGRDVAWGARANNPQWIQIDLGKVMYVSGIITKGVTIYRSQWSGFYWVSEYKVHYKMHATDPMFMVVANGQWGGEKVFKGNENGSNEVKNMFYEPIQMQIIRIVIVDWPRNKNTLAMRLELLGCDVRHDGLSGYTYGCGGIHTLTNPAGFISSMNYPRNYRNNANCQWNIIAPKDQVVMLNFEGEISIEEVNNCMMEYVEIIDVVDGREKSIGKLCGKQKPGQYSSTENMLKVRFMTDHYETDQGFRANYHFMNSSGCGGPQLLWGESGVFDSGNLPQKRGRERQCSWYINASEDENRNEYRQPIMMQGPFLQLIEMNFVRVATAKNSKQISQCSAMIQIENESVGSETVTFCSNFTEPYITSENRVKVLFSTQDQTAAGFQASYRAVAASGCGGKRDLDGPSGSFSTLNYPAKYLENMRCQWNISSFPNQTIELNFETFDLEGDRDCRYDYVSVYAGPSEMNLLGKYCGSRTFEQPFISDSGMIRVIFVSDKVNENIGFSATYDIRDSDYEPPPNVDYTISKQTTTRPRPTTDEAFRRITTQRITTGWQSTYVTSVKTAKAATPRTTTYRAGASMSTNRDLTINKAKSASPARPNLQTGTVTEEMVKWIIVGLASVSGLLMLLVLLGIILCCRQHFARVVEVHSANNNHSSILQNYAYDFSIGSTNHSIRSRQMEPPESSQISESISRQGTLRRTTSKDSHIYFSIEECCKKRVGSLKEDVRIESQHGKQKVHFHAKCQNSSDSNYTRKDSGDGSGTLISEEEVDDEYYEEELDAMSGSDEAEGQVCGKSKSDTEQGDMVDAKEDSQKKLVHNILYISTDNVVDRDNV